LEELTIKIKSGHTPILIPIIPFFHHSSIPFGLLEFDVNPPGWTKPGPLGQDALLPLSWITRLFPGIPSAFEDVHADVTFLD
jgi:hypothetical protein